MTWLTNWNFRKAIIISNSGSVLTDYQVSITVDTATLIVATKLRSDCGDIRFTSSDGSTIINYWIESGINSSSTKIWIKIPSLSTGTNTIYLYYNNPSATTTSNGTNTFIEFLSFESGLESFNGGSRNTVQAYDGSYSFQGAVDAYARRANLVVTRPYIREYSYYVPSGQSGSICGIVHSSPTDNRGFSLTFGYPTSGKWGYVNNVPTWIDSGVGITYDTWHTLKIIIWASLTDTYTDNTLIFAGSTQVQDPPYAGNDNIYLYSGKTFYIDAIRTRKYSATEPTTCVGGEEIPTVSWLTNWNRRKLLTISGSTSSQTDYQMKLIVHKSTSTDTSTDIYIGTNVNNDFSDLRFTSNNGTTLLSYWIESYTSGSVATVWIKIPSIPISPCTTTIYLYYNNSSATTTSTTTTFIREINGVKGAWIFNNDALDNSGNGNNGTLVNSPTYITGKFGNSLSFTASSTQYVNIGSSSTLDVAASNADFTYAAWVNVNSYAGNASIISRGLNSSSIYYPLTILFYNSNGTVQLTMIGSNPNGSSYPLSSTSIKDNLWHHVLVMRNGSNGYVYIDGVQRGTASVANRTYGSTENTLIGANYNEISRAIQYPFNGLIDEPRIYSRALTSSEITDLYNNYGYVTPNYPGKELVRKYVSPEPTFSSIGTEQTSPNITATSMTITPSETPCRYGLCTVTVSVTWTNNGGTTGSFIPNIKIDTVAISPDPYPSQELAPSANVTKTFVISNLATGTRNICPYPN